MPLSKDTAKELLLALVAAIKEISGNDSDSAADDDEPKKGKGKKGKSVSLDDIKEKLVEYVQENGKPAARKLMKKFEIETLKDLEEDDYAKFMTALGGEEAADDEPEEEDEPKKGKGKKGKKGDDLFGDDDE